ncbi:MAG: putative PEP-binding protein [Oscillospiraceae bacterium]
MFPMIISVDEVRQIKEFCRKIQSELYAENIPFGKVELGIMRDPRRRHHQP